MLQCCGEMSVGKVRVLTLVSSSGMVTATSFRVVQKSFQWTGWDTPEFVKLGRSFNRGTE